MIKLTLLMAIRNEGERIGKFLERHVPYFDEVVVVHDGACLDNALEIARQYSNVTVFERPGYHRPHPHWEWALRNAIDGGWVAQFDPDEEMCDELLQDLRQIVGQADFVGKDGIALTQIPYMDGIELKHHKPWKIFKHSDLVHYPDHPHGGIEGLTNGLILDEKYYFNHHLRAVDVPSKMRRRNAILRRRISEEPNSPRRVAWEQGLRVPDGWLDVLDAKGISLEESESLAKLVKNLSQKVADMMAEVVGIETKQELVSADAEYVATMLDVPVSRVRQWQKAAK